MIKKLDLSLVVCVADDVRIDRLLKTVDCYCEVIVVLNGTTEQVKKIVQSYEHTDRFCLKSIELLERNLSKARNIGAKVATYDKLVFYDSDCEIVEGALELFSNKLNEYFVVDGRVLFKADSFQSKIISFTREIGIPGYALCPSIGFNKQILSKVKYYFFDDDIRWIEDFEFNMRVKEAHISIGVIEELTCIHDNLTFKQDLKSAYRYGTGVKRAVKKGIYPKGPDGNWEVIIPIMKRNFLSGVYYVFWNIMYCFGYFFGC